MVACGGNKAPARDDAAVVVEAPASDAGTSQVAGDLAWRWDNPRVTSNNLRGIWGSSATDIYAVGDHGTILHSRDRGRTWSAEHSGTDANLRAVWGSGADDVYVVGYDATILHSTDAGKTWTAQNSPGRSNLNAVWGSGKRDVYVLDAAGDVLHSTDAGHKWATRRSASYGKQQLHGIWGSAENDVYVVGYDEVSDCDHCGFTPRGMVLHTDDGGATWDQDDSAGVPHAIFGVDEDHVYVARADLRDIKDAINEIALDAYIFAIWASGADDVYAVGEDGAILHTTDAKTWTPQASGVTHNLRAVWGAGRGDVFVVGDHGTILHTTDAGATWTPPAAATAADLTAVWRTFAVGEGGTIVHRTQDWTSQSSGTNERLVGVWGSGDDDVFVVGRAGAILHSVDAGRTWHPQISGVKRLAAIWGSSKADVYAVGGAGTILHTTDSGATWTAQRSDTKEDLTAIWGSSRDDIYAVGSLGAILRSTDAGQTWTAQPGVVKPALGGASTLTAIWGSSKNDVYIAGHGKILHSTDAGKTWEIHDTDERDGNPRAIWGSGADDVYVLMNRSRPVAHGPFLDGAVLHSTDRGESWTKLGAWDRGLLAIGGDAQGVVVVGWAGGILRYGP